MKLFAPFTSLMALVTSCVFVKIVSTRRLLEPQVVASVHLVGSNEGYCLTLGLEPGCDANKSIVVDKFANGEVCGILQDGYPGGYAQVHAKIECLKITTDVKGVKTAVIS